MCCSKNGVRARLGTSISGSAFVFPFQKPPMSFFTDEFGGRRVSTHMKNFICHLHMCSIPCEMNIGTVTQALDEQGQPQNAGLLPQIEQLLSQVNVLFRKVRPYQHHIATVTERHGCLLVTANRIIRIGAPPSPAQNSSQRHTSVAYRLQSGLDFSWVKP